MFIKLGRGIFFLWFIKLVMTSFTLNLISVKESFHDIFKKTLNITPVNITSFTVSLFSVPFLRHNNPIAFFLLIKNSLYGLRFLLNSNNI